MTALITAPITEPFTVFLVGMQCRSFTSLWKVPLIAGKMGQMQRELMKDHDSGLLWGANFIQFSPLTTLYLSYWKSSDHIHRFVSDPKFSHLKAAPDYLKRFGNNSSLGVWHETYEVNPTQSENLYFGMAPFGVSAFIDPVKITSANRSFLQRLRSLIDF